MALAKKCTRCKKYYDHYPTGKKVQYNAVKRTMLDSTGNWVNGEGAMDLCEDCMAAFDKFMTEVIFDD